MSSNQWLYPAFLDATNDNSTDQSQPPVSSEPQYQNQCHSQQQGQPQQSNFSGGVLNFDPNMSYDVYDLQQGQFTPAIDSQFQHPLPSHQFHPVPDSLMSNDIWLQGMCIYA